MISNDDFFDVRLATTEADRLGALRLRYTVFIEEMGGGGPLVDHVQRFEQDAFDPACDHLVLVDLRREAKSLDHVVGVYRLLPCDRANRGIGFYSGGEFDLAPLFASGRRLLELGRSCLHARYRRGTGLWRLWSGLADYVDRSGTDILFGVASFHGTKLDMLREPLSFLHHRHLAPEHLRVRTRQMDWREDELMPLEYIDRRRAVQALPPLIKAYLRLGGGVGQGAFVDHSFNTTDVCLVIDAARISRQHRQIYAKAGDVRSPGNQADEA